MRTTVLKRVAKWFCGLALLITFIWIIATYSRPMFSTYFGPYHIPFVRRPIVKKPAVDVNDNTAFVDGPRNVIVVVLLDEPLKANDGIQVYPARTYSIFQTVECGEVRVDRVDNSITVLRFPSLEIARHDLPAGAARRLREAIDPRVLDCDVLSFITEKLPDTPEGRSTAKWLKRLLSSFHKRRHVSAINVPHSASSVCLNLENCRNARR